MVLDTVVGKKRGIVVLFPQIDVDCDVELLERRSMNARF